MPPRPRRTIPRRYDSVGRQIWRWHHWGRLRRGEIRGFEWLYPLEAEYVGAWEEERMPLEELLRMEEGDFVVCRAWIKLPQRDLWGRELWMERGHNFRGQVFDIRRWEWGPTPDFTTSSSSNSTVNYDTDDTDYLFQVVGTRFP